jgi:hypothetical protein
MWVCPSRNTPSSQNSQAQTILSVSEQNEGKLQVNAMFPAPIALMPAGRNVMVYPAVAGGFIPGKIA